MSTIYLAILLFIILALFLCKGGSSKKEAAYLKICFLIMLVLHTFFNPEFSDNYSYKIGYQEFQSMSLIQVFRENSYSLKAETGYRVLCKLLSYISKEWRFGMFVISLIMLSGYYYAVKRYSSMIWLSVLLIMVGPFCQSLFVLRQHLAMGVILLAYPYILEKKLLPYLAICLIAISFHQTAAIFLPTYFLYHMKRSKTLNVVLVLAFITLYYTFSFFLTMSASLSMETASYGDYYLVESRGAGTNNKLALLMGSILILRFFLLRNHFYEKGINRLLSIMMILGTILATVGIGFIATARLNMYYSAASFLYIPNTLKYIKGKEMRVICGMGYFLFMLYFMVKNADGSHMTEFWFFSK